MPPNPDSERIALATLAEGGIGASPKPAERVARRAREKMQSDRPDDALVMLATPRPIEAAAAINTAKDKLRDTIEDAGLKGVIDSQSALIAELVEKGFRGMSATERTTIVNQFRDFLKKDTGITSLFPDGCPEILRYGNDRERFSLALAGRLLQNPVFVDFVEAQINTELGRSVEYGEKHRLDKEKTDLSSEKSDKKKERAKLAKRIKEITNGRLPTTESDLKKAEEVKSKTEMARDRLSDALTQLKSFRDQLTAKKSPPDLTLYNPISPKSPLVVNSANISSELYNYQKYSQQVEAKLAQATARLDTLSKTRDTLVNEKSTKETDVEAIDARIVTIDARLTEITTAHATVNADVTSEEGKLKSGFENILKNATIAALTKSREIVATTESQRKSDIEGRLGERAERRKSRDEAERLRQEALKKSVHEKLVKFVVDNYRQGNRFQRRRNLRGAMRDILSNQGNEGREAEKFDNSEKILRKFRRNTSSTHQLNGRSENRKFIELYTNSDTRKEMQDLVMKTIVELTVQRDAKWLKKKLSKDKAMEMTMMGSVLPALVNTSIGEDRLRKAANKYKHLSGCGRLASMFESAGAVHYQDLTFNDMLWILMLSGGGAALLA